MFERADQALAFLWSVFSGISAGAVYQSLRLLRVSTKAGPLWTGVIDLAFWLLAAAFLGFASSKGGEGSLRYYLVMGFACGLMILSFGIALVRACCHKVRRRAAGKR